MRKKLMKKQNNPNSAEDSKSESEKEESQSDLQDNDETTGRYADASEKNDS